MAEEKKTGYKRAKFAWKFCNKVQAKLGIFAETFGWKSCVSSHFLFSQAVKLGIRPRAWQSVMVMSKIRHESQVYLTTESQVLPTGKDFAWKTPKTSRKKI